LRWDHVNLATRTVRLPGTKTGASMRPLSHAACDLLAKLDRFGDLVFPPTRGDGTMSGFRKLWDRITRFGGLPADITPHTLRHSFASLAGDLGFSELTIGTLIGHKGASVTSRYIHAADVVLLAAADAVASETATRMGEAKPAAKVVELRRSSGGG
jgi:integrase